LNVYGFTLLRNGIKYDYPFRESLTSLAGITKKVFLALGKSGDGTEEAISDLEFLHIIPTVWDDHMRDGGVILSQQTNTALKVLRDVHSKEFGAWGFYLQSDEVLHEEDYCQILADLETAENSGCDALSFRYLHFWKNHHVLAINKKWYPHEIRAIKLNSGIESWGDAQGFRPLQKVFQSDARIYHYGHVREKDRYLNKKKDILKLYHADEKLPKYRRREARFEQQTECIPFCGNHPRFMQDRILRLGDYWQADEAENVFILDDSQNYRPQFIAKIHAKNIRWVSATGEVPLGHKSRLVILCPTWWQKLRYHSIVPTKMRSKLARPWTREFLLTLKLSERGVGLKA